MNTYNLIAISGSLRKESFNSALVRAFKERAPEGVSVEILPIDAFPFYNQDGEGNYPAIAQETKDKIRAADGVLIATPEYNRSVPGVLKNAFDWLSRPYGDNAFSEKAVFVMGATGGNVGTALAQSDLKKSLLFSNAFVVGQPEFYLTQSPDKFDAEGKLTDEDTAKHIDGAFAAFTKFIDRVRD